ncbi:hypothetical protein [Leptospira kirschneri]
MTPIPICNVAPFSIKEATFLPMASSMSEGFSEKCSCKGRFPSTKE